MSMMLAIETATDICSVAYKDEEGKVAEKRAEARGSHSEVLFLFIREMMQEHDFGMDDLSAVLVSEGPGSYTGLRIAASGVKGLLFGSDVPLYRVQTLASYAAGAVEKIDATRIHAVIDARRKHLYHQVFSIQNNELRAESEVDTRPIAAFADIVQAGDVIIGSGIERLDAQVTGQAQLLGIGAVTARSLLSLHKRPESEHFIERTEPGLFDPKYYTSRQGKSL